MGLKCVRGEERRNGVKREAMGERLDKDTNNGDKTKIKESRAVRAADRQNPTQCLVSTDHWQSNELIK